MAEVRTRAELVEKALDVLAPPENERLPSHGVDLSELAVALVEKFGGAPGLANHVFMVFKQAPKGGQVRSRVLQQVLSIVEKHTNLEGKIGGESDMTDEELILYIGKMTEQ